MNFCQTPKPPYYAVIFTTQRVDNSNDGYNEMAEKIDQMVKDQPGYLGMESVRDENGCGITACYWSDAASISKWKQNLAHQEAQTKGMSDWYEDYFLRVAKVERDYGTV